LCWCVMSILGWSNEENNFQKFSKYFLKNIKLNQSHISLAIYVLILFVTNNYTFVRLKSCFRGGYKWNKMYYINRKQWQSLWNLQ
jgi:hypothetical protein